MPRSTLTEQLTGGAKPPAEKTFAPLTLLQNSAFPCLRYSEGEVVGALPIFEDAGLPEVDIPDIGSVHLAGTSAPLGSVPKSKVIPFLLWLYIFVHIGGLCEPKNVLDIVPAWAAQLCGSASSTASATAPSHERSGRSIEHGL